MFRSSDVVIFKKHCVLLIRSKNRNVSICRFANPEGFFVKNKKEQLKLVL